MNLYSGNGDNGETSDLKGQKLPKDDIMLHLVGTADEVNCHLGLIKSMFAGVEPNQVLNPAICQFIEKIQKNLMKLMSHFSDVNNTNYFFSKNDIAELENEIDLLTKNTLIQSEFILPGRSVIEAQIQITRAVVRRAERIFFTACKEKPLCSYAGGYLNRLSDYLFVLSRQNHW